MADAAFDLMIKKKRTADRPVFLFLDDNYRRGVKVPSSLMVSLSLSEDPISHRSRDHTMPKEIKIL